MTQIIKLPDIYIDEVKEYARKGYSPSRIANLLGFGKYERQLLLERISSQVMFIMLVTYKLLNLDRMILIKHSKRRQIMEIWKPSNYLLSVKMIVGLKNLDKNYLAYDTT